MAILIDTERRRYTPSGLQFFCDNLIMGLSEIGANNISIYGPSKLYDFRLERFSPLHKVYHRISPKYRVVHITHQNQSYFPNKGSEKRILTVHDLNYLHLSQVERSTKENFIAQVRQNIEQADHIVCISHFTKEDLLNYASLFPGVNDKPISVIHNGLDTVPKYSDEILNAHLPAELKGIPFALNIGVANAKKNQQAIVEAMPRMDRDVVLVVNNLENSYTRFIKSRAKELGVSQRLHLMQQVSDEVKHALLRHCEVMIYPSIIEGFGYPPVEAMVYGKPVILSRKASLPEIGGPEAFYMDDTSAWSVDKAYQTFKENMTTYDSNRIKEWASQFSYRKMAEEYYKLYTSLI